MFERRAVYIIGSGNISLATHMQPLRVPLIKAPGVSVAGYHATEMRR